MKNWKTIASLFAMASVACSSANDEPECSLAGTYEYKATLESGDCPSDTSSIFVTITDGTQPTAEFQGISGGCPMTKTGACTAQTKCSLRLKDPVDPTNGEGSVQYTWTFTKSGFSGASALTIPPAVSLPGGCSGTYRVSATRR